MNKQAGMIWCEGTTVLGIAADGTTVQLGQTLLTLKGASRRPGYTIFPVDAYTREYLEANPDPSSW